MIQIDNFDQWLALGLAYDDGDFDDDPTLKTQIGLALDAFDAEALIQDQFSDSEAA